MLYRYFKISHQPPLCRPSDVSKANAGCRQVGVLHSTCRSLKFDKLIYLVWLTVADERTFTRHYPLNFVWDTNKKRPRPIAFRHGNHIRCQIGKMKWILALATYPVSVEWGIQKFYKPVLRSEKIVFENEQKLFFSKICDGRRLIDGMNMIKKGKYLS